MTFIGALTLACRSGHCRRIGMRLTSHDGKTPEPGISAGAVRDSTSRRPFVYTISLLATRDRAWALASWVDDVCHTDAGGNGRVPVRPSSGRSHRSGTENRLDRRFQGGQ